MNQVRWKVCGLRDNISDVVALQPDYIGFIFYSKSPRYVGNNFEMLLINNSTPKKVGVFVNETLDFVHNIFLKYQLDYVQLHGNESPEYCEELMRKKVKVIKAFEMDESFDFGRLKKYESFTDYFLFDTKTKLYGGSGKSFDWRILNKYSLDKKYFLSGGLSLDNFDKLTQLDLKKVKALDVNSKFEISPGLKNVEMLEKLSDKLKELNNDIIISK